MALSNKEKKEIVKIIKEGRKNNETGEEIANYLNDEGYSTHTGKKWSPANVSRMALYAGGRKLRKQPNGYKKSKKSKVASVTKTTVKKRDNFDVMKEIFNSDLSEDTKRTLVGKLTESAI